MKRLLMILALLIPSLSRAQEFVRMIDYYTSEPVTR